MAISNIYNSEFIVTDPFVKCRHESSSFTSFEIILMILFQFMLFVLYFFGITYIWMLKVRAKAHNYLCALPNRKIRAYIRRQKKAPLVKKVKL